MPRCTRTCLFAYICILLEIQVTEAVGLLGLAPFLRLSDSLLTPVLQILIHGAITGSGTVSSAVKPPSQSGAAVGEMIIFNKCS